MNELRKATLNHLLNTQDALNWNWINEANTAGITLHLCTVEKLEGNMLTLKDKNGKLHTAHEERFEIA